MVLGVLCVSLIMNALVLPIQFFIPVIARDLLMVGPFWGGLLGAAEGIGTLFGASIIALKRQIRYHGRLFVAGALITALGVTLVAWAKSILIWSIFLEEALEPVRELTPCWPHISPVWMKLARHVSPR